MSLEVIDLISREDLLARIDFRESLSFYPKCERRFGTVLGPYRLLEPIPCGIDSCHTAHKLGYLISTSDGLETAIGGHCGKKNFGTDFKKEQRRVDDAIRKRRQLQAIDQLINSLPELLSTIQQLENDYKILQDKKLRLMDSIGTTLFKELKHRAEKGNTSITKEERMTKKEAAIYFETSNRKEEDNLPWPTKTITIATISGLGFLSSNFKNMLVTNLLNPIKELQKTNKQDLENYKPKQLSSTAKWVGELPAGIKAAQQVISEGKAFFSDENLEKLKHIGADPRLLRAINQT